MKKTSWGGQICPARNRPDNGRCRYHLVQWQDACKRTGPLQLQELARRHMDGNNLWSVIIGNHWTAVQQWPDIRKHPTITAQLRPGNESEAEWAIHDFFLWRSDGWAVQGQLLCVEKWIFPEFRYRDKEAERDNSNHDNQQPEFFTKCKRTYNSDIGKARKLKRCYRWLVYPECTLSTEFTASHGGGFPSWYTINSYSRMIWFIQSQKTLPFRGSVYQENSFPRICFHASLYAGWTPVRT